MEAGVHLQGTSPIGQVVSPIPKASSAARSPLSSAAIVRYPGLKLCRVRNEAYLEFSFIKIPASSFSAPAALSSSFIRGTPLLPALTFSPSHRQLSHLHAPASITVMGAHKVLAPDAGYHTLQELPLCRGRSWCWSGRLGEEVAKVHYDLSPPPRPEKVSLAEASCSFPPVPQIHSFVS